MESVSSIDQQANVVARILQHRLTPKLVGFIMATSLCFAFLDTIGFHCFMLSCGEGPIEELEDGLIKMHFLFFFSFIDWGHLWQAILLFWLMSLTILMHLLQVYLGELSGLIRKFTIPLKDGRSDTPEEIFIKILLLFILTVLPLFLSSVPRAVAIASLAAIVFYGSLKGRSDSVSNFFLNAVANVIFMVGVILLTHDIASTSFESVPMSTWGNWYKILELHGFWMKDMPLIIIFIFFGSLYLGFIYYGLACPADKPQQRIFIWITISVVVLIALLCYMEFSYPSSEEFASRWKELSQKNNLDYGKIENVVRSILIRSIERRDIIWFICGYAAPPMLYGILCLLGGFVTRKNYDNSLSK